MRKALGLTLIAVLAVACQPRSDRPGMEGESQFGQQGQEQESQQQQQQAGEMGQRFTEVGTVTSSSENELTLRRESGEEVNLNLRDTTAITMDGRFVQADALPEGAEVRASYTMDGDNRVAESIEVLRAGDSGQQQQRQEQMRQQEQQQEYPQ